MRNGDIVGYEMWKATVLPSIKDIGDGAEMLISLIKEKVNLNFAITINQEFETNFIQISKEITAYVKRTYGNFTDIDEDYNRYKDEVFTTVKQVEPFIDLLNNQLSISIEIIKSEQEEKHCYVAFTFPNPESRDLMNLRLKGRKTFTEGPFNGKDSPSFDEKNPSMLKFWGTRGDDETVALSFPNPDMGPQLFNSLPNLRLTLGTDDSELPVIKPLDNNIAMTTCPEYLLGYTQLLIVPKFPQTLNPGALYVQIEGFYDKFFLRSRVISKPMPIELRQKDQFKEALAADEIKINFEYFKDDYQIQVPQNKSVFKLVKALCPSPAAFTTKERLKPIRTFHGDHYVPQGQAMSLLVVEAGLRLEEYKSLARSSENALIYLVDKIKAKVDLEVSVRELEKEKKNLEKQLTSLNPSYFAPKSSEVTNSGCSSFFGCFSSKKKTTPEDKYEEKQNTLGEGASKNLLALETQYKKVSFQLERLNQDLSTQESQTQEATNEYTLFREKQRLLRTQPRSSSNDTIEPPSQTESASGSAVTFT